MFRDAHRATRPAGPVGSAGLVDPQSFDHLAARYDRFAVLIGDELITWLRFHLPARAGRALDAGCGTGVHTGLLADRCNEVLAVDLSAPMLDYARCHRDRGNIRWEHRDFHDVTRAADGPFDIVLSTYTLHHAPDFPAALTHLGGLLRPGGVLALVDVVNPDAGPDYLGVRRTADPAALRSTAWRTFAGDMLHRRRPIREAAEVLRLSLDPDWIDHQATDQLLTPDEWDTAIRAAYSEATTTPLHKACATVWHAPAATHFEPSPLTPGTERG